MPAWRSRVLQYGAVQLSNWLLRLLCMTLRPISMQPQVSRRVWEEGKPVLVAFWHGRLLYFIHLYQHQPFTVLVSRSRDGEFLSRVVQRFGGHTTRGSSRRGGGQGLLEMVRRVRQGWHAIVTPDGPRGPRYQVQPGVVALAKRTGAPILPVTYSAQWKTQLNSWDAFVVPLPFSRLVVVYGEPIYVPGSAAAATLQAKRLELETSLRQITAVADNYFGGLRTKA